MVSKLEKKADIIEEDKVVVSTEEIGQKIISEKISQVMTRRETPYQLLQFTSAPEIKKLPGQSRIIAIETANHKEAQLKEILTITDLARPLSPMPYISAAKEMVQTVYALVPNEGAILELEKTLSGVLATKIKYSAEKSTVLQINGSIGLIGGKMEDELSSLSYSLDATPWPSALIPEKSKSPLTDLPRLGPCSYLLINQRQLDLQSQAVRERFINHLGVLANSSDFFLSFDQLGNLTILALNESSMGILTQMANTIQKMMQKQLHIYFGKAEITKNTEDQILLNGYLPRFEIAHLLELGETEAGFYSSQRDLELITGGRDERSVMLLQHREKGLFVEVKLERINTLNVGHGPDRLIGYEKEETDLREALMLGSETKLVLLEGHAGTGKSRLIEEVTSKKPHRIVISMDPAGRNIPGFSLTNFADQVATYASYHKNYFEDNPGLLRALLEFAEKDENEKLNEVNSFGGIVNSLCIAALQILSEKKANLTIVIDDIHHVDRYSDAPIMAIVSDLINNEFFDGKIILARRPEQRYHSIEQDNLIRETNKKARISLQEEDGSSKINFRNQEIATQYIFHSLPESIRINRGDQTPKMLGNWVSIVGKLATTPFEMTTIIRALLSNPEKYLLIQKDIIELSEKGYKQLEKISGMDLIIYHLERIREELQPMELKALQTIAIIGQKLNTLAELVRVLGEAFHLNKQETQKILQDLTKKGFLKSNDKEILTKDGVVNLECYSIWHENIRDIVLNNTLDEIGRAELASNLLGALVEFNGISSMHYFNLLNCAALVKKQEDKYFWQEYTEIALDVISASKSRKLYGQGFEVSSAILNGLTKMGLNGNVINETLLNLTNGLKVDENIGELVVTALAARAENGYFLGKFSQVFEATKILEEIYGAFEEHQSTLQRFYLMSFYSAMIKRDTKMMEEFYLKIDLEDLPVEERLLVDLKLAYRKKNKEKCQEIIDQLYQMPEKPAELFRQVIRVEIEEFIEELGKDGSDGDVVLAGLDLNSRQRHKAVVLRDKLTQLREILTNKTNSKDKLSPIHELQVLDMEGQIASLNGSYDQAIKSFGEYWRLAMQMEIYPDVVRAAKQKGDIEVIRALSFFAKSKITYLGENIATDKNIQLAEEKARQNVNYRRILKEAISTYSEEGILIAEKHNPHYKFLLSVQRLRAICLLMETYTIAESTFLREEILEWRKVARIDIDFINQREFQDIPETLDSTTELSKFETCYYITPMVLWCRNICRRLNRPIKMGKQPYESQIAIDGSRLLASYFRDDLLGENRRKILAMQGK